MGTVCPTLLAAPLGRRAHTLPAPQAPGRAVRPAVAEGSCPAAPAIGRRELLGRRLPPQACSPAVPGEGAEDPDPRRQGRPHLAGPGPGAQRADAGGRGRVRVPAAGPTGLNAPPAGPPRSAARGPQRPPPCTRRPCGSGGARTACPSSRRSSSGQAWTSYSFLRLASRLGTDGPRASAPALSGPLPAGEPTAGTPDRVGSRLRPVCPLLLCSAFPSAK